MTTHYVLDLNVARAAYKTWNSLFPKVTPYYAVKCNPDPLIIRTLATLGCGFDCASPREVDAVLEVDPTRHEKIIYANPCKRPDDIRYVARKEITRTTFDSICEVEKMAGCASSVSR